MNSLQLTIRKCISKSFKICSFTAMMFVFQACYGTSRDFGYDVRLSGAVRSKTTGQPIKGIKISIRGGDEYNYTITDGNGKFNFYVYCENNGLSDTFSHDSFPVLFSDIDGKNNGHFQNRLIVVNPFGKNEVKLNIELADFAEKN